MPWPASSPTTSTPSLSERIPDEEWLAQAKRLPVHGKTRVRHRREGRPNLVIGHDADRWWCYCQACKAGAVVQKEHVLITGRKAPEGSTWLDLPADRLPLLSMDSFAQGAVLGLLAQKNMDAMYLPDLWFSDERKRLLLDTGQGWLGRDTTGGSHQKWLTYSGTPYLGAPEGRDRAIVVEDPFSYYKVRWALRHETQHAVYCALGTAVKAALALQLRLHHRVTMFMDGDAAGYRGAEAGASKMRGLGVQAVARCAPPGLDPKDLTVQQIKEHVWT